MDKYELVKKLRNLQDSSEVKKVSLQTAKKRGWKSLQDLLLTVKRQVSVLKHLNSTASNIVIHTALNHNWLCA